MITSVNSGFKITFEILNIEHKDTPRLRLKLNSLLYSQSCIESVLENHELKKMKNMHKYPSFCEFHYKCA